MFETRVMNSAGNMRAGQKISFMYHGCERVGHVTVVDTERDYFTVDHTDQKLHDGKRFSTYNFHKLGSKVSLV